MSISTDFLLDENNDLMIRDGDFVIGESDAQHLALMMMSSPGDFKADPILGVAAFRYIKSNNSASKRNKFNKEIRLQLGYDNWNLQSLDTSNLANVVINADHPNNTSPF